MKITLWLGATTPRGTVLKGYSIRRVENHCSRASYRTILISNYCYKQWLNLAAAALPKSRDDFSQHRKKKSSWGWTSSQRLRFPKFKFNRFLTFTLTLWIDSQPDYRSQLPWTHLQNGCLLNWTSLWAWLTSRTIPSFLYSPYVWLISSVEGQLSACNAKEGAITHWARLPTWAHATWWSWRITKTFTSRTGSLNHNSYTVTTGESQGYSRKNGTNCHNQQT